MLLPDGGRCEFGRWFHRGTVPSKLSRRDVVIAPDRLSYRDGPGWSDLSVLFSRGGLCRPLEMVLLRRLLGPNTERISNSVTPILLNGSAFVQQRYTIGPARWGGRGGLG